MRKTVEYSFSADVVDDELFYEYTLRVASTAGMLEELLDMLRAHRDPDPDDPPSMGWKKEEYSEQRAQLCCGWLIHHLGAHTVEGAQGLGRFESSGAP